MLKIIRNKGRDNTGFKKLKAQEICGLQALG